MPLKILLAALLASLSLAAPAAGAEDDFHLLRLEGRQVKWGAPRLGAPAHIRYAFVTAKVHDAAARNCRDMVPLDALAARSGLSLEAIEREAAAAFRLWEQAAGLTFEEAATPGDADILIGALSRPHGYAFANVHPRPAMAMTGRGGGRGLGGDDDAAAPGERTGPVPVSPIVRSAVCLNPLHHWKIGFGGPAGAYDLRYTLAHEIGHAIGLDHYNRPGLLMFFKYSENFRGPQAGDIAGARALYGPPLRGK